MVRNLSAATTTITVITTTALATGNSCGIVMGSSDGWILLREVRRKVPSIPGLQADAEREQAKHAKGGRKEGSVRPGESLTGSCGCVPEVTSSSPQSLPMVCQEREEPRPLRRTERGHKHTRKT